MKIEEFDPDGPVTAEWVAVRNAAATYDRPGEPAFTLDEAKGLLRGFGGVEGIAVIARKDDGTPVGATSIILPMKENRSVASFSVQVSPDHRRQGVGSALLAHVHDVARAHGRTILSTASEFERGVSPPGVGFAAKFGFEAALNESVRVLKLPFDEAAVAALEQESADASPDYSVRYWQDRCPDELVEGLMELERQMSLDAPSGKFDEEESVWDEARLRAVEDNSRKMGSTGYATGAVHNPTGRLAAYTLLGINASIPATGRQFITIVGRQDRGHKLGLRVKIANLRRVAENSPATTLVQTWNADVNEHMIAVNEALGFEATGGVIAWKKELVVS